MRHKPRPTRIVRLGDTDICRVEVFMRRWWWQRERWTPLRYRCSATGLMRVWEGTYDNAVKLQQDFIKDAWEVVFRAENNWIVEKETR